MTLGLATNLIKKEDKQMCISKKELESKIAEIRKYKALIEEAEAVRKSLESEVIDYMTSNNLSEEITDSAKISYKAQERRTLDKARLEAILGEDLKPFENVTIYSVLRIN